MPQKGCAMLPMTTTIKLFGNKKTVSVYCTEICEYLKKEDYNLILIPSDVESAQNNNPYIEISGLKESVHVIGKKLCACGMKVTIIVVPEGYTFRQLGHD